MVYIKGIWGVDEIHQVWYADLDDANVPKVTVNAPTQELKTAASSKFNIYPTPVKEKLNINWYEALENPVHWRLISLSGSVVKEGVTQSGQISEQIDTYDVKEGFYLICTEDKINSIVEKRKIIIIK